MDDAPSRVAEEARSEYLALPTHNNTAQAASGPSSEGGIYSLTSAFTRIYAEIALGVSDAMPANADRDEWDDYLQETAIKALKCLRANPKYFKPGKERRWASRAARRLRKNRERNDGLRAIHDEAIMEELRACHFDAKTLDEVVEDEERRYAVVDAVRLIQPLRVRSAGIARHFRGLGPSDAAAFLGVSPRTFKRLHQEFKRQLALLLSDWNPRKGDDHE